jgi:hypothetical protein
MWRRITDIRIIPLIAVLVLSALVVGSLRAQDDTPVETPTPTSTSTSTDTPPLTPTPTSTSTDTPPLTPTPTSTPIDTPTATLTPTSTSTDTPAVTLTPTSTSTDTPTLTPTATSTPTEAPTSTVPGTVTAAAPTAVPQLLVTQNEPSQITAGQSANLSIIGANFTETTSVRLIGYGFLDTLFINSSAITAVLPSTLPAGWYAVEISDPTHGTATAPNTLTVLAAAVEATETPEPTLTPGEPTLIVRTFSASPSSIYPGDTTQLTLEIVNVGSRTAEGGVVTLGQSNFSPANGQASVTLPDLPPSSTTATYFAVIAPADAAEGAAAIPIVLSSRDVSGQTYSDEATLSVTILAEETGEARVVLDAYSVLPSMALPGEAVTVEATFVNSGTETASQMLAQLDTAGGILIAGSQGSSFSIGDMRAGASATITMPLVVADDAPAGVQAQAFTVTYLQGDETRQTSASISLTVRQVVEESQVLLGSYHVTPESVLPGGAVTVEATFVNDGTETASQVLVQLDTAGGVLIAGSQGSSFRMGDMPPGASATITMPLVVGNEAPAGVQAQSFTISYLQGDETRQSSASISLTVEQVVEGSSILLLQSYSTGQEAALQPGQQFTYEMSLRNAGTLSLSNLLVTFGQAQSSSSGTTSTSTTATVTFAPLGNGDTMFLGDLPAGETVTLSQEFIVSNDLESGVYRLPITVQYQDPDGTVNEQSMNASMVVIVQPRLRVTLDEALDDPLTLGQIYTLSLKIANLGSSDVALTQMRVTGENVTVTEGAETPLDPLQSDDDTTKTATIEPVAKSAYSFAVEVDYLDDLNRTQTYTSTFSGEVAEPARPAMPAPSAATTEPPQEENLLGRLLLGFFGFGG